MNGMDLIEAVNGMDEELVSVSAPKKERRRLRPRAWIAIAAAALIVFGCATVGASALIRGKFGPIRTGTHGYTASFELQKYKWSKFKGEIRETPDIIREQYATFTPQPVYSSFFSHPGSYVKNFSTLREAADYVGLKALKTPEPPFGADCVVNVFGDAEGRIGDVEIFLQHIVIPSDPSAGDLGGMLRISILTENSEKSTVLTGGDWGDYDPGRIDYKEFTTSKGVLCQYTEVGIGQNSRELISGYVVYEGILYNLSINFKPGEYDNAVKMLNDWAEKF